MDAATAVLAYRGIVLLVPVALGVPAMLVLEQRLRRETHDVMACARATRSRCSAAAASPPPSCFAPDGALDIVRARRRLEGAVPERWFSEDELRELSRPTMDRAIEALDAGDTETARALCEAMKHEWLMLHDLYAASSPGC